jgi:hypothetical protein
VHLGEVDGLGALEASSGQMTGTLAPPGPPRRADGAARMLEREERELRRQR